MSRRWLFLSSIFRLWVPSWWICWLVILLFMHSQLIISIGLLDRLAMMAIRGSMLRHSFRMLMHNVLHFGQSRDWDAFWHHLVLVCGPIRRCQARQRLLLQLPFLAIVIGLPSFDFILDTREDRCCLLCGVWIAIGSLRPICNALVVSVEKFGLCCGLVYLYLLITLVDGLLILAATWLKSVCLLLDKCPKSCCWISLTNTTYGWVAYLIRGTLLQLVLRLMSLPRHHLCRFSH